MNRKNYFEMLGLSFDPAESNIRKIERAIKEWRVGLENAKGNENDVAKRSALEQELALHDDMVAVMTTNKTRNQEAKEIREQKISQLEQLIDILLVGVSGTPEVTGAQIRNVNDKLKLSIETIRTVYEKKGFVIQNPNNNMNLNNEFMQSSVFDGIKNKIAEFNKMNIAAAPWSSKVQDLYDLACFSNGGGEADKESYHRKRTSELCDIMRTMSAKYATDMSESGHLMADLYTAGVTQVYKDETARKKYDQSLKRDQLEEFFSLLKKAPEIFKKDSLFAESCIRTIEKYFPDYDVALALYNNGAGIKQDPYEPMEAFIHLACAVCRTPAKFRTQEEAKKGVCAACGAALYTKCPQCQKMIPASADRCSCGFVISEMHFFEDYIKETESALKEMDLVKAEKQLKNAENAWPGNIKLPGLRKKVEEASAKYKKPLERLNTLIASGNYYQAQNMLNTTLAAMPNLRADDQRKKITAQIMYAQNKMPAKSDLDAADKCLDILGVVKDYQPAIDMLRILPPPGKPVMNELSFGDGSGLVCNVSWKASRERGITYSVVRKEGGIPAHHSDGRELAKDLTTLEFKDRGVQPGIVYGYAVFACRLGIYSAPAGKEIVKYSEIDKTKLRISAGSNVCHLSWVLPQNCVGVRILRKEGGSYPSEEPDRDSILIAGNVSVSYDDCQVVNGKSYGYRLQCLYSSETGLCHSQGITLLLTPEELPVSMKNISASVSGQTVMVKWTPPDTKKRNILIREIKGNISRNLLGTVVAVSELNSLLGAGKDLAHTGSETGQCQFEIPANSSCRIGVISLSGSNGILSGLLEVSSIEKCEIDRSESRIENGILKLKLKSVPRYLEKIHYTITTKKGETAPWAAKEHAINHAMDVVQADEYKRDGMIVVQPVPSEDIYVSVIGEFKMPNGQRVFSETAKIKLSNKPKEVIHYFLSWSGGIFGRKAKKCRLVIQTEAAETPDMKLVYRTDGHIPMRLDDPKAAILYEINEREEGFRGHQFEYEFPDSTWNIVPPGAELRLMLTAEALAEYELVCEDQQSLKVPGK